MPADLGFVKLMRCETTRDLLRDPFAFTLLATIASRARFTDEPNLAGLRFGQAFMGDWTEIGLTRGQARAAMRRLSKFGLAHFDGGPAGTVATLLDTRVFSLRDERGNRKRDRLIHDAKPMGRDQPHDQPTASSPPTTGQPATTNQKDQQEKKAKQNQFSMADGAAAGCEPAITAEQIYLAYPRKCARIAAVVAIEKAMAQTGAAHLLNRTRAYAAAVTKWSDYDRKFVPHPATWFNRGCYDDDPAAWERSYGNMHQIAAPSKNDYADGFFGEHANAE